MTAKLTSFVILFFVSSITLANGILEKPIVDERVELLSIVFRLADCDEYTSDKNKLYTERIHQHFDQYKDHELIRYIRKVRQYGVGFDAVMQMAVHIDQAPSFNPIIEFSSSIPENRWGKKRALKFLKLLREFYIDADCATFFSSEQEYYEDVVEAFLPNYERLDLDWYVKFYGEEPTEKFKIIIAPGIGGNNYGPNISTKDGSKEIYAIMGAWNFDSLGNHVFDTDEYFPILLHEFNHSFVNPLLKFHKVGLEQSCSILFNSVSGEMRNQGYGDWEVTFNESVVRACVIKYMLDHQFETSVIQEETRDQFYRGFIWIEDLVEELKTYSSQRSQFNSFNEFMPVLTRSFEGFSQKIQEYEKTYNESRPKIVSISEFENGATDVNANIKTITINFDREMSGIGYSINYGSLGKKCYPEITRIYYSEDKKSVLLDVNLKENQEYQLILLSRGFKSSDNTPIKDYELKFQTK